MENPEHSDAAAHERAAPQSPLDSSEPTVYIVDPDETVRNSLKKLFRPLELPVMSFPSAEEFLEGFNGIKAGCLIVEADLPGMSGLDLQETLSRRRIDLPVIVLSGQGSVPTAVRALRAGAIDFVEKPLVPHVLVRQVRKVVWQARHSSATTRDRGTP